MLDIACPSNANYCCEHLYIAFVKNNGYIHFLYIKVSHSNTLLANIIYIKA